jgi:two-component system, LytTR family, response regulator
MILKAIAIDDEPKALEVIKSHAAKVPFLELKHCFTNAFDAIPYLHQNQVDLIFLDIKMPDISGFEFVACLPESPMIIFTTAYSEFGVQGFEVNAIDYLLKPFSLARFTRASNKAMDRLKIRQGEQPQFLFIKTGYEEERVNIGDIQYLESDGNYITYVLKERKLLCRQTLNEALAQLPEGLFDRIHRSFIIALDKIEKLGRQEVTVGGRPIPIGASYEDRIPVIRQKLML